MTTKTNFSAPAERIGKTASVRRAVGARANVLGSVEGAIADGDTHSEGHRSVDDAEQYASEGPDSPDKRTLNRTSDERINELVHEVALTFDYLEEYNEPATSPEANNDRENAMTTARASVLIPSPAASMPFEDFIDGMCLFASKWVGKIAVDRVAIRVESLYNDITFRMIVFEYRRAVLARDDHRKRMFRSMVTGDAVYTADDWDNDISSPKVKAYDDVLYDMLVRLPGNAEDERESIKKPRE